jgi:hypothetical protein
MTRRDYWTRHEAITSQAWAIWIGKEPEMDDDARSENKGTVQDAVNNTYYSGIKDQQWLAKTLTRLGIA